MTVVHDYTMKAPLGLATAVKGHALHLCVEDTSALGKAADALPWQRIREVTGPTTDEFASFTGYHNRARWNLWWKGFDVGRLLDLSPILRRRTVTVLVSPDDPDLHEKLVLGESLSLQMAVPLSDPDAWDLAAMNRILSYVLITGATRRVRIEPMSSMVTTARGRDHLNLWNFADEKVHRNLWVDDAGRVSLSARLAQTHPFGSLNELTVEDLEQTSCYRRLEGYVEGLFVSQSDCATCRSYPLCGGWLRYVEPAYDCQVWQLVLNSLSDAVGDAERARRLARHR
jgi:hypothetical protein